MGKLRTQQNRLVSISDIRSGSFANESALVVSEFRHYDASTESYFQYLEIMSNTRGLERYFRIFGKFCSSQGSMTRHLRSSR